jgi:hypothetical protein
VATEPPIRFTPGPAPKRITRSGPTLIPEDPVRPFDGKKLKRAPHTRHHNTRQRSSHSNENNIFTGSGYNTRQRPIVNHVTTVGPEKNIFTAPTPNITTTVREDSYIQHNRATDEITVIPRANHVICEETGKVLQYRALRQGKDKTVWTNGFCNELGRLSQGWNDKKGTNTIFFIERGEIPQGRKATYVKAVCDIRPHKEETHRVRLTAGGNLVDYPGNVSTPTADVTTIKTHWNSVISDTKSRYMCMDVKDFYLNNPMARPEFIRIAVEMIPVEFMDAYQLWNLVDNGYIYARVDKGMYGFPQAGKIAQERLTKVLEPFGYAPAPITAGFWLHKSRPITFTIVVDDFGVKYTGREHALHLKQALESTYKITTDWDGELYIGITLKWDYANERVFLSMPGYVKAALHKFLHPKPSRDQNSPYPWVAPIFGRHSQDTPDPDTSPLLPANEQTALQQIVGTFLYYARAIDSTMLMALNSLASQQNKGTEHTAKQITQFLNYCATHPDATLVFYKSDMVLYFYSDASYCSEPGARSRYGGFFYLGPKPLDPSKPPKSMPPLNGAIHIECGIMHNVLASAMESEMGGLFNNCQKAVPLRISLVEMKHPQPPTPVATDNSAACSIVNDTAKQKRSRAIDMRFYWVRDRVRQGHFHVFWESGKENMADYWTKHHPTYHHTAMRTKILHPTPRDIANAQDTRTTPRSQRGCVVTGRESGILTSRSPNRFQETGNGTPAVLRNRTPSANHGTPAVLRNRTPSANHQSSTKTKLINYSSI